MTTAGGDGSGTRGGGAYDFDFLIVGSGFGGSVSACRLAEKGYSVAVMEMGRRWKAEDFPKTNWNTPRWVWRPGLKLFGFFNMRPFRHVMIICGNAVGGDSITYANTLLVPPDHIWDEGSWAGASDWKQEMPTHYDSAKRMLGVTENKLLGPADHMLKKMGEAAGVGHTFKPTQVATFFPPEGEAGGKTYPDPYFGGEGPARGTCTACGGCMMGCKHNAKNTLDKNYLWFAEKRGAKIFEETQVVDVKLLNGWEDGRAGWTRIFTWLGSAIRHPLVFLRMSNPVGFARQTLVFLVMQTVDASLRMRLRRNWWWPFGKLLSSEGGPIPTYIPQANAFTEKVAKMFGGSPMTTLTEILFNIPFTAHCMGGCAIAKTPQQGVIDSQNRVFNYRNLYVVDGSMLGANLGVNPSLTITAPAERAMSFIPPHAQAPAVYSGEAPDELEHALRGEPK